MSSTDRKPPTTADSSSAGAAGTNSVLAVTPLEDDLVALQRLFSNSNWKINATRTCGEALAVLREQKMPVVICDCDSPDGGWKDILNQLANMPNPPRLIVTSRVADDRLWAEVLNLGGYDVLEKPFDSKEVFRVVSLAWRHWKDEWEQTNQILNLSRNIQTA